MGIAHATHHALSYAKYIINYVYGTEHGSCAPLPEASSKMWLFRTDEILHGPRIKMPDYRWDRPPTNLTTKEHFAGMLLSVLDKHNVVPFEVIDDRDYVIFTFLQLGGSPCKGCLGLRMPRLKVLWEDAIEDDDLRNQKDFEEVVRLATWVSFAATKKIANLTRSETNGYIHVALGNKDIWDIDNIFVPAGLSENKEMFEIFLWELKELCPLAVMDYHIEYDIERALTRMAISRDYDDGIDFVSIIFKGNYSDEDVRKAMVLEENPGPIFDFT